MRAATGKQKDTNCIINQAHFWPPCLQLCHATDLFKICLASYVCRCLVLLIMKLCHRPGSHCVWPAKPLPCIPAPRTFLLRRCRLPTRVCRQLSICLCATMRTCILFPTPLCCNPFKCDQSPTEQIKKSSDFK